MQNSAARSAIDVGAVIADTYTVEALLGRGGMGAVFLARHNRLPGKKVAIKVLHPEVAHAEVLARFRREAQIASMLGHPNIVTVENIADLPDGSPYLVLEYLAGETLASRLRAGPLPAEQVFSIVRQVGSALGAAHRAGVVHRDLKPQNIFLVPTEFDGRTVEIAKVLDFGISKMRGSQTVKTQDSALLGTPQYMAPEQATGQHTSVDERTDIFALGAIVYEMLAGHPAFVGASIPEVVFKVVYEQPQALQQAAPNVTPAVASAVTRAMAKPAADRFANVGEFVEALTGQTLPPPRPRSASVAPPDPSAAEPLKRSSQDAFAQTMGSGDHGPSPAAGVAPTVSSERGAQGTPLTSASAGPVAPVTAGARVDAPAPPSLVLPPPRSSRALVGAVVAALGLGGALAYVLLRDHEREHETTPEHEIVVVRDPAGSQAGSQAVGSQAVGSQGAGSAAAPARSPTAPSTRHDTVDPKGSGSQTAKPDAAGSGAAKPADKPTSDKPASTAKGLDHTAPPHGGAENTTTSRLVTTNPKPPDETEPAGHNNDPSVKAQLDEAQRGIDSGDKADLAKVRRIANMALSNPDAGVGQKARAHMFVAIVACRTGHFEEAIGSYRQVMHYPKMKTRVAEDCLAAGYDMSSVKE